MGNVLLLDQLDRLRRGCQRPMGNVLLLDQRHWLQRPHSEKVVREHGFPQSHFRNQQRERWRYRVEFSGQCNPLLWSRRCFSFHGPG